TKDGVLINNWKSCRSPDEEIVVSKPIPIPPGINYRAEEVSFDFSANKIPISATDLFLQVVYRGKLGEEPDAVVVATKDISEPTYIAEYSRWDQFMYCSSWSTISNDRYGVACPNDFVAWCTIDGAYPSAE